MTRTAPAGGPSGKLLRFQRAMCRQAPTGGATREEPSVRSCSCRPPRGFVQRAVRAIGAGFCASGVDHVNPTAPMPDIHSSGDCYRFRKAWLRSSIHATTARLDFRRFPIEPTAHPCSAGHAMCPSGVQLMPYQSPRAYGAKSRAMCKRRNRTALSGTCGGVRRGWASGVSGPRGAAGARTCGVGSRRWRRRSAPGSARRPRMRPSPCPSAR